jgi:hypothetical protein
MSDVDLKTELAACRRSAEEANRVMGTWMRRAIQAENSSAWLWPVVRAAQAVHAVSKYSSEYPLAVERLNVAVATFEKLYFAASEPR